MAMMKAKRFLVATLAAAVTITGTGFVPALASAQTVVYAASPTIKLSETRVTMIPGDAFGLDAVVTNSTATPVWSSNNESVATVSGSGDNVVVTAVSEGNAVISCEVGNRIARCYIKVSIPNYNVTLNTYRKEMAPGNTLDLSAILSTYSDCDESVFGTPVWTSSDESVATVSADGMNATVTAAGFGRSTIKFTLGKKSASCVVYVDAKSISLDSTSIKLNEGDLHQIVPVVAPAGNWDIEYTSSDETVATVSDTGLIEAVPSLGAKSKTATITVSVVGTTRKATVRVVVSGKANKSIVLSDKEKTITAGKDFTLTAKAAGPTYENNVVWSSSNDDIARITYSDDGQAIIEGVSPGRAIITAMLDEKHQATCIVNVKAPKIVVGFKRNPYSVKKGETVDVEANVVGAIDSTKVSFEVINPRYAVNGKISIVSADESVTDGVARCTVQGDATGSSAYVRITVDNFGKKITKITRVKVMNR